MAEISKISAVAIANVAKVDAVTKANIADINGLTIPSAAVGTPTAAYSVRLLGSAVGISSYTGACMRVRRASDSVEADVGFDSNDDLSLTSPISNTSDAQSYTDFADFVDHTGTPTDAYVRYWYDQSNNANHASQNASSVQPQIYNASTGLRDNNGKAQLEVQPGALTTTITSVSQPFTISSVLERTNVYARVLGNNNNMYWQTNAVFTWLGANVGAGITTANNRQTGFFGVGNGASSSGKLYDSTAQPTPVSISSTSTLDLSILAARVDFVNSGNRINMQEFVLWSSDETGYRTNIVNDINGHFTIY